jgi:type II secretory pathway component PulJ
MGRQSQKIGFTLLEILVASALLLLVVGLMVRVLVPAFRISAETSIRSELHQRGHHALNRLGFDLQKTGSTGLKIFQTSPSRTLIALQQLEDADPQADPVFQNGLIIYVWEQNQLTRFTYEDPDPTFSEAPQSYTVGELETFITQSKAKPLSQDIVNFTITDADPDPSRLKQPLTLTLQMERVHKDKVQKLTLSRSITQRNS